MPPQPKQLILNLMLAAEANTLSSREAVAACALFGIRENSVRVTLVRLGSEGLIEAAGRGTYRLGPQATELADELAGWRDSAARVTEWSGAWIMAGTGALGRSDRAALRIRERALALLGFCELEPTLYVRPANLAGGTESVRERLHRLGLEAEAAVFTATDLGRARDDKARQLWQGAALNKGYRSMQKKLETWLQHAHALEADAAARECYLLGNEAIKKLVFDPLLPAPLVDTEARRSFIDSVLKFDAIGHQIWRHLFQHQLLTSPRAPEPAHV